MNWLKKGKIYVPDGSLDWSLSHAQVPVTDVSISDDFWRIHFSTRDGSNRSLPGYVDVNKDTFEVINISQEPTLQLGALGTFDDCGVMPSWIVDHEGKKYMYYIGWNVRNTISYHNSVGLAISLDNGKSYTRYSDGPLWDRNTIEPHYSGTSCVLIDGNGIWRNWYLSCTEWRMVNGKSEPRYHIKHAESKDGINWVRKGTVCIDYKDEHEAGIVKASVIKDGTVYKMWYSYRNFDNYRTDPANSYRIGYAESNDGISWNRMDSRAGIDVGPEDWDSQMIEYPHVFKSNGRLLMLYNGNGFGKTGFGIAELNYG